MPISGFTEPINCNPVAVTEYSPGEGFDKAILGLSIPPPISGVLDVDYSDFTAGSFLFIGSDNFLAEDNANAFWDDANNVAQLSNIQVTDAYLQIDYLTAASIPFIDSNLRVAQDNANLSWNDTTNLATIANIQVTGTILQLDFMTSGSIPYIDSNLRVEEDNANWFYDATNKRVGLGTNNPLLSLHIKKAVVPAIRLEASQAGVNNHSYYRTDATGGAIGFFGAYGNDVQHSAIWRGKVYLRNASGTGVIFGISDSDPNDFSWYRDPGGPSEDLLMQLHYNGYLSLYTAVSPSGTAGDGFFMYSKDFVAGNACPYFKTEDGTVIGLNQSLLTTDNPTFVKVEIEDLEIFAFAGL